MRFHDACHVFDLRIVGVAQDGRAVRCKNRLEIARTRLLSLHPHSRSRRGSFRQQSGLCFVDSCELAVFVVAAQLRAEHLPEFVIQVSRNDPNGAAEM